MAGGIKKRVAVSDQFVFNPLSHTRINKSHLVDLYGRIEWSTPPPWSLLACRSTFRDAWGDNKRYMLDCTDQTPADLFDALHL